MAFIEGKKGDVFLRRAYPCKCLISPGESWSTYPQKYIHHISVYSLVFLFASFQADPRNSASKVGNQTNSQDPQAVNSRVFVGNLNTFQVTKNDIEKMFQPYGRIAGTYVRRIKPRRVMCPPQLLRCESVTSTLW
jgi:hypothetical protein